MSYEGYREFLTRAGRYLTAGAWGPAPRVEGDPIEFCNSVDTTNGFEEDGPSSFEASKALICMIDVWHKDHYGNRYAVSEPRYAPTGTKWQAYKAENDTSY